MVCYLIGDGFIRMCSFVKFFLAWALEFSSVKHSCKYKQLKGKKKYKKTWWKVMKLKPNKGINATLTSKHLRTGVSNLWATTGPRPVSNQARWVEGACMHTWSSTWVSPRPLHPCTKLHSHGGRALTHEVPFAPMEFHARAQAPFAHASHAKLPFARAERSRLPLTHTHPTPGWAAKVESLGTAAFKVGLLKSHGWDEGKLIVTRWKKN